jgi:hypothetical protein
MAAHSHPLLISKAGEMLLRRLSLLLFLLCWTTPSPVGAQPARPRAGSPSFHRLAVAGRRAAVSPSGFRPYSIAPHSPWRYRLKSVLPDGDSRIAHEADLGPVPVPDRSDLSVDRIPRGEPFRAIVPLRC